MKKQTKNNATASSDRLQSFQKLRSNTASPCTGIGVSQIRFVCGSLNEIAATLAMALPREILETRDRYVHSFVFARFWFWFFFLRQSTPSFARALDGMCRSQSMTNGMLQPKKKNGRNQSEWGFPVMRKWFLWRSDGEHSISRGGAIY